jgi:hypothetical protein
VDHATHPWIIGLLNDRFRFGKGGPLARIKRAIRETSTMNQSARLHTISEAIRQIEAEFWCALTTRTARDAERGCVRSKPSGDVVADSEKHEFVRWSVFTAVLAEVDPDLIRQVLNDGNYVVRTLAPALRKERAG